jgi:hypothetical protein
MIAGARNRAMMTSSVQNRTHEMAREQADSARSALVELLPLNAA